MTDIPTIWIVNEAGHDYSKATEAVPGAEIRPMTLGNVNPLLIDRLSFNAARGIAGFAKKSDYILISGTPVLNALVMALWITQFGECNFLQWDAKKQRYKRFTLTTEGMKDLLESQMVR